MEDIRFLQVRYLSGPNIWTYRPVLETWLDIGELEELPSNKIDGFNDRLIAMLPALAEHHCGVGERGGFLQRLESGTWAGHILEHVIIELLNLSGMPTGFGQTRSTSKLGVYRMVFRARDEQVARHALQEGHALLMAALRAQPFDVAASVARLRDKVDDCYLGPSTASIVAGATDRGIPHIRLNGGNLVQLGHGCKQHRIWTAETDATSAIAEGIASDKDMTKRLLAACGVPVPVGEVVSTKEEAWEAALELGLPVAVKPSDGNHGRGVTLDLNIEADVHAAFDLADKHGSEVLVERYIAGNEHRMLVVGGKVVAAARGEAAWVVGDGSSTVNELIDAQINIDPRRGTTEDFPLSRLVADEDGAILLDLQRQGLSPSSVAKAGQRVLIQRNGNVAIDCTDEVHPDVAYQVALAARVVGLDIAGIDLVAEDISQPLEAQGGAIVEVNAGPGLMMHLQPAEGTPRPVGQAIVNHLFPDDQDGRIPIVGITGSRDTHWLARLVAWLMHLSGRQVGLATRDGIYVDHRQLEKGDGRRFSAARRLLMNRNVGAAVFESTAHSILLEGLPYDRCQVGVVTDIDGYELLAEFDIQEEEQIYKVMRTQVDVVLAAGACVLNAEVPLIASMAELCDGEVIYFSLHQDAAPLAGHFEAGGRAVYASGFDVILQEGKGTVIMTGLLDPTHALTLRQCTQCSDQVPSLLLAAIATAWAQGIAPDLIAAGIDTFAKN